MWYWSNKKLLNHSPACKKISSIHKFCQQILGSHELHDHTHISTSPSKNNWHNFLLSWICTTIQKTSSFHQFILEILPIFESHDQTGPTHFWSRPPKKFLNQLLIYVNLYQHAKNQAISKICSEDVLIKKSYWLRTFWPVSQKLEFSQIWYLWSNTANNINFHYRANPVKTNDRIFQYIQKTCFWAIFPILGAKTFFLENSALPCTTSYRFLASCQNLQKNIYNSKKNAQTGGTMDGWKDRRADRLFHRTLPTNAGGPKKS